MQDSANKKMEKLTQYKALLLGWSGGRMGSNTQRSCQEMTRRGLDWSGLGGSRGSRFEFTKSRGYLVREQKTHWWCFEVNSHSLSELNW